MTVRKIYEIALRILGVLFLAQAVRYAGTLVWSTTYMFLNTGTSDGMAFSTIFTVGSLIMSLIVGALLLTRASRWAARLAASDDDVQLQISLQSVDALRIGMALVGASILVTGLASGLGELIRAVSFGGMLTDGAPFGYTVQWDRLIASFVRIIAGFALLRYGSVQRRVSAAAGFLEESRGDSGDTDEPPAA